MMSEYRPCIVDDHKALFHIWTEKSYPVEASPLMGGAPAGQINYLYGVVEYEDGSVHLCVPRDGHNEKELSRKMSGWVAKPNLNDINLTVPF